MLIDDVHNFISAQVPISGISISGDGAITICYSDGATNEQKQLGEKILLQVPLMLAKKEKISQLNNDFETTIKQGWESGRGFKLGLTIEDTSLLLGLFVLAKEGAVLGLNPPPIIDTDGNPHNLTMAELTVLMLQYGQHRAQLAFIDANKRKAVENANSIEELSQI